MLKYFVGLELFIIALMLLPTYRYLKKKHKINIWLKALNLKQHQAAFAKIYDNVDGFDLSKRAREKHDAFEYTYGEIDFLSFIALISLTHPNENTRFYDLGCGVGKAVISCAMVYDMQFYCGVELFKELYNSAVKQQQHLLRLPEYVANAKNILFVCEDFLNVNLNDATLIFINSTAFVGHTWQLLNEKLAATIGSATIITVSKKLTTGMFTVVFSTQINMSWGVATVFIHKKMNLM